MPKIVLPDTNGGFNISTINDNFQAIADELNDKVLYRDNPVGETNTLESDVDVNGQRIYNLPTPVLPSEAARLQDVINATAGIIPASFIPFTPYLDIVATNVQDAIEEVKDAVNLPVGTAKIANNAVTAEKLADEAVTDAKVAAGAAIDSAKLAFLQAGTGAVTRSVRDKLRDIVSVKDFGAKGDGVTDDSAAVRLALDSLSARGGVVLFPDAGPYVIDSVVYIPTRTSIFGSGGVRIKGNNTTIVHGANTVFESGTGEKSTVALGGASNWDLPPETVGTIHYNSSIEGFNFVGNNGRPIRVHNWIQGCSLRDLYGTGFFTMIETKRCFYLCVDSIIGRPLQDGRADTTPIFKFVDSNNTLTLTNMHASGITAGGLPRGVGFEFDAGVQGVCLGGGNSAEGCVNGLVLRSIVYSMKIDSVYFELNTTAIRSIAANLTNLDIVACEFEDNANDINVDNWIDGCFSASNKTEASVVFGSGCTHRVELPAQSLSELNHTTWVQFPSGWSVPGGCQVVRNDLIFNSAGGFGSALFLNSPVSSGGAGVSSLAYTGSCFNVGNLIPFCSTTGLGDTSLVINTKIAYSANLSSVLFDIGITTDSVFSIAGRISVNNSVFRDDVVGVTVTPSDNGGFLALTIGPFGANISAFTGKVRVV